MGLFARLLGKKDTSSILAMYNDVKYVVETTNSLPDTDSVKKSAKENFPGFRVLARKLEADLDKEKVRYERIRWR